MSIYQRPGYLRLWGRENIYSRHHQSILCRRQTDFKFEAITNMEFNPKSFQHTAGLLYRYNEYNQYYAFMSYDEDEKVYTLNVAKVDCGKYTLLEQVIINHTAITIKLGVNLDKGKFYYKIALENDFKEIGGEFDTTVLSDEYASPLGFTGAFIGLAAQDLRGQNTHADFKDFSYIVK